MVLRELGSFLEYDGSHLRDGREGDSLLIVLCVCWNCIVVVVGNEKRVWCWNAKECVPGVVS